MTQDGHYSLKELSNLKGTAKLRFIWDYYKIPIFLICVCVYAAGYIVWRNVTAEFPQLYLAYVNVEAGEALDRQLTEGFIDYLQPREKRSTVKAARNLAITDDLLNVDGSYVYASQVKILSAIDNQQLDVVLMNKEAFDAFSQNGFLADLNSFAKEHELTDLEPYFIDNIEILSDNMTDVMTDPTVEYHSETTSYPMGIDVSEFPCIKEAGFPDHVYLGIIANTERADKAAAFVTYLAG
jgi:hypothetical protein